MASDLWDFLVDPNNRAVLGWAGGGIVVVIGGVWAVVKFFFSTKRRVPSLRIEAAQGGVAAGRDIRESRIDTTGIGKKR